MVTNAAWKARARGLLKDELKKRGVSYKDLAGRLAKMGIRDQSDLSIANKLARGGFSAVFMIQCLTAIGCRQIRFNFED